FRPRPTTRTADDPGRSPGGFALPLRPDDEGVPRGVGAPREPAGGFPTDRPSRVPLGYPSHHRSVPSLRPPAVPVPGRRGRRTPRGDDDGQLPAGLGLREQRG